MTPAPPLSAGGDYPIANDVELQNQGLFCCGAMGKCLNPAAIAIEMVFPGEIIPLHKAPHSMRDNRLALFTHAHVGGARGLTRAFGLLFSLTALSESNASPATNMGAAPTATSATSATSKQAESRIWMTVRDRRFAITLADTQAAREYAALLSLSIDMPPEQERETR